MTNYVAKDEGSGVRFLGERSCDFLILIFTCGSHGYLVHGIKVGLTVGSSLRNTNLYHATCQYIEVNDDTTVNVSFIHLFWVYGKSASLYLRTIVTYSDPSAAGYCGYSTVRVDLIADNIHYLIMSSGSIVHNVQGYRLRMPSNRDCICGVEHLKHLAH